MRIRIITSIVFCLSLIVIITKNCDSKKNFDRNIVQSRILTVDSVMDIGGRIVQPYIKGNDVIYVEKNKYSDTVFYFDTEIPMQKLLQKHFLSVPTQHFECIDKEDIYYIDKLSLTKKTTNSYTRVNTGSIRCAQFIKHDDSCILLGTDTISNTTAFYHKKDGNWILSKILCQNKDKDDIYKNVLKYSGHFIVCQNTILYYCDKYSCVYAFSKHGEFIAEIHTKDNIPLPEIQTFNGMYMYRRGKTSYSTLAAFETNGIIYAASFYSEGRKLVWDSYDMSNDKYLGSIIIPDVPESNNSLKYSLYHQGKLLLLTDCNIYLLTIR